MSVIFVCLQISSFQQYSKFSFWPDFISIREFHAWHAPVETLNDLLPFNWLTILLTQKFANVFRIGVSARKEASIRCEIIYKLSCEKTGFLSMHKQRHRSAVL